MQLAVRIDKRPGESHMALVMSTATGPFSLALVSHKTNWQPGGLLGIPPNAKLPRTHWFAICRHILGHLTATTG
jgi:hypothetical protein